MIAVAFHCMYSADHPRARAAVVELAEAQQRATPHVPRLSVAKLTKSEKHPHLRGVLCRHVCSRVIALLRTAPRAPRGRSRRARADAATARSSGRTRTRRRAPSARACSTRQVRFSLLHEQRPWHGHFHFHFHFHFHVCHTSHVARGRVAGWTCGETQRNQGGRNPVSYRGPALGPLPRKGISKKAPPSPFCVFSWHGVVPNWPWAGPGGVHRHGNQRLGDEHAP